MSTRREELKAFLRTHRAAIAPEDLGLPRGERRFTPGLRREEVAMAANVGVSWYTWLEQGREIRVSQSAIARIARALRLSPSDEAYLYELTEVRPPADSAPVARLPANLQTLLDAYNGPAAAFDPVLDRVACNARYALLYGIGQPSAERENNELWQIFANPSRRLLYADWPMMARHTIGIFRRSYLRHIDEPRVARLLSDLRESVPDFTAFWDEQRSTALHSQAVTLRHPSLGTLHIASTGMSIGEVPGYLAVFVTAADRETAKALSQPYNAALSLVA